MQSRKLTSDTIIGAVLTCIGLAALVASLAINKDADGGWGARIFPLIGSGALIVLGMIDLVKSRGIDRPKKVPAPVGQIVGLLLLSLIYVWLIGRFGYLLSTGFTGAAVLMIFGVRNPVGLLAAAILCPAVYHFVFFEMLGVFPPYGEWFDPLDVIQGY